MVQSVGEISKCDHLIESYWTILSFDNVHYAEKWF